MRRRAWIAAASIGLTLVWASGASRAIGTDEDGPPGDPDFVTGKRAIEAKDWNTAIKALSSAALRDTRNADIQNYLGYAHRQLGQMEKAFAYYEQALKLNPRHRGAHEYAGEAALIAGDLPRAQRHLGALERICLLPCEEYDDLKAAITAHLAKQAR
jgi:tetratricopeptide (TPR) repeat protein